jgi:transcriptional regulator with XRE-family HTH domain
MKTSTKSNNHPTSFSHPRQKLLEREAYGRTPADVTSIAMQPPATVQYMDVGSYIGTGGQLRREQLVERFSTGGCVVVSMKHPFDNAHNLAITSARAVLEDVRADLGLSIADTADVMRVSRRTVYDWLEGQVPRSGAADRLAQLAQVARYWRGLGAPRAGKDLVRTRIAEQATLLTLFSAESLDVPTIQQTLDRVWQHLQVTTVNRQTNSIASRLRARGAVAPPEADQRAELDRLTQHVSFGDNNDTDK